MSLATDFLDLISLMWDIEQFNMWLPVHHGSIAYLLDGLYETDEYRSVYDELYALAKEKDANEFAMKATLKIAELCKADQRYTESDLADLEKRLANQKRNYDGKKMFGVAMIKEKYMPDWFFAMFEGYINLEKIKMETAVLTYCQEKENKTKEEANEIFARLNSCFDLLNEFYFYVKNGRFTTFYPITDGGLTAEEISNTIGITPLDAYLYLVYIRKDREKALAEYEALKVQNTNKSEVQTLMEETKQVENEVVTEVETEVKTEEVAEAAAPETSNELLEKLSALQEAVQTLQESFDSKIAIDAHKNGLFDSMHKELTRYQNGALDKIVDTIALDIIQLVDTTKGHVRVYEKKDPTEDNYKRLLRIVKGVAEDLEDILYRQNIESYRVVGHEVDVRRQKIIQVVPTDDKSKDNLVAVRAADGYEKGDKVLRPERIKIFKYSAEAAENSTEN